MQLARLVLLAGALRCAWAFQSPRQTAGLALKSDAHRRLPLRAATAVLSASTAENEKGHAAHEGGRLAGVDRPGPEMFNAVSYFTPIFQPDDQSSNFGVLDLGCISPDLCK